MTVHPSWVTIQPTVNDQCLTPSGYYQEAKTSFRRTHPKTPYLQSQVTEGSC